MPDFLTMDKDDKACIWRFRYSLKTKPEAFCKFMQSAELNDVYEQEEAMRVLREWSPIEKLEDALPLLSTKFAANSEYNKEIEENEKLADVYHKIRL